MNSDTPSTSSKRLFISGIWSENPALVKLLGLCPLVLIIATTVTILELLIQAWLPSLHSSLGIFLPLIVTNCLIIGRAEAFAARNELKESIIDALAMGTGFLWILVLLGSLRELIGQGTLLDQANILFGTQAKEWTFQIFSADNGVLLALLPPGAFITLGLLLALKNLADSIFQKRKS